MTMMAKPLSGQANTGREVVAPGFAQALGRVRLQHDLITLFGFLAGDWSAALALFGLHRYLALISGISRAARVPR